MSIIMIFAVLVVNVSAAGESVNVTIKTSADSVLPGDEITVTVNVATNYYATSMRWPVLFSSDFFELVEGSVAQTDALKSHGGSFTSSEAPGTKVNTAKYPQDKYVGVLLQWQGASASGMAAFNVPDGMDAFTFKLKVKDTIAEGDEGIIAIPEDSTLFYNYMLTDIEEPLTPDKVVQCKDLVYNVGSKTVSYAAPELLPVEGTSTVVDDDNKIIRGVDANTTDNLDKYIYATNGAEIVLTPVVDGRMGTGTKVELVLGDTVLDTYTLVIKGDANGDALIDVADSILLDLVSVGEIEFNASQILALDLVKDGTADTNDLTVLNAYLNFLGDIDQTA